MAKTKKIVNLGQNVVLEDNSDYVKALKDELAEQALIQIGDAVQRGATLMCPTDTGRLKASINYATHTKIGDTDKAKNSKAKDSKPRGQVEEGSVYIGTNVEYAVYVEMGHTTPSGKHIEAKPFMQQGVKNKIGEVQEILKDYLGRVDNG